jgi:membrane-associated HD superfamily phosphohydrolase
MQVRNINTTSTTSQEAKIIPIYQESAHIEREIDQHVQSIRALINKLRPSDRQQYFNGLLNHLLMNETNYPLTLDTSSTSDADFSCLSEKELDLIRELSSTLHRLHLEADGEL